MTSQVFIHPTYFGNFIFFCPICGKGHKFEKEDFNGNFSKPTITKTIDGCGATVQDGIIYKDGKQYQMEVF